MIVFAGFLMLGSVHPASDAGMIFCFFSLLLLLIFIFFWFVLGAADDARETCVGPCVVAEAYTAFVDTARHTGMMWPIFTRRLFVPCTRSCSSRWWRPAGSTEL